MKDNKWRAEWAARAAFEWVKWELGPNWKRLCRGIPVEYCCDPLLIVGYGKKRSR